MHLYECIRTNGVITCMRMETLWRWRTCFVYDIFHLC